MTNAQARRPSISVAAVVLVWAVCSQALAIRVPGGGNPATDCYGEFEVDGVASVAAPQTVRCMDGDPACDHDGTVNGVCTFRVALCANQTDLAPACTPPFPPTPLKAMRPLGLAARLGLRPPPLDGSACGAFVDVPVQLHRRGQRAGSRRLRMVTLASSRPRRDADLMVLDCVPNGGICPGDCCPNPNGGPSELVYTVASTGTDLDTGFTGVSHNFPVIAGAKLSLCLTGCDQTTNPVCMASGPTGKQTANTDTFGPPLPLFAAGVPVCVVNRFRDPVVQGTVNVQTGEYQSMVNGTPTPVVLLSDIYNTSANQVCPQCSAGAIGGTGTCDSGPNQGQHCTTSGTVQVVNASAGINERYTLSNDCPPGGQQGSKTGTVTIILPVTTGIDSRTGKCPGQPKDDQCGTFGAACTVDCDGQPDPKGGINQWCCSDANHTPCFPTAANSGEPDHAIVRTGAAVVAAPAWPETTYPKTGTDAKLAATFCIGSSGSATVDQVAGLPGPGAVIFNGTQEWRK